MERNLEEKGWSTLNGKPVPILYPEVAKAHALHQFLGRDADGRTLVAEQEALLDREQIADSWERHFLRSLWSLADREVSEYRAEQSQERSRSSGRRGGKDLKTMA